MTVTTIEKRTFDIDELKAIDILSDAYCGKYPESNLCKNCAAYIDKVCIAQVCSRLSLIEENRTTIACMKQDGGYC